MLTRSSCQVASHLKPLDLLHLARVSSTFRNALLSRSSRQAWAAARKNFVPEIPDGPHDLAEPLYARLLFERNCMVRRVHCGRFTCYPLIPQYIQMCGAAEADKVDYANFRRYCDTCWRYAVVVCRVRTISGRLHLTNCQ